MRIYFCILAFLVTFALSVFLVSRMKVVNDAPWTQVDNVVVETGYINTITPSEQDLGWVWIGPHEKLQLAPPNLTKAANTWRAGKRVHEWQAGYTPDKPLAYCLESDDKQTKCWDFASVLTFTNNLTTTAP